MAARTVPPVPAFFSGQKLTGTAMNQLGTWMQFWSDRPMFRMYQSVVQSIPNATYTQITCDTSDYDTDSGRSGTTPWSYTIPVGMSGRWQLGGVVGFVANNTGTRFGLIYRNGVQIASSQIPLPGAAASTEVVIDPDTYALNAGDVLALYGYQNITGGGALNTDAGHCTLWGRLESLANP